MVVKDFDDFTPIVQVSPSGPRSAQGQLFTKILNGFDNYGSSPSTNKRPLLRKKVAQGEETDIKLLELEHAKVQAEDEYQRTLDVSAKLANQLVMSRSSTPWSDTMSSFKRSSRCGSPVDGFVADGKMKGKGWLPLGSWLPKSWTHCPPSRYWTTKHDASSRKSQSQASHKLTARLWQPLDQIVEALPVRVRPPQVALRALLHEVDQYHAFAQLLVGRMHARGLCEPPLWFDNRGALALPSLEATSGAPLVTALDLAAACALHQKTCKVLQLGDIETGCGRLVGCFGALKHLNANVLPETLPQSLETLTLASPNSIKLDFKVIRQRPAALQELSLQGNFSTSGLGSFIESIDSLSWVNLALWQFHPSAEELLSAAAFVLSHEGLFAWPNSHVLESALELVGNNLVQQKNYLMAASRAATRVLQETVWDAEMTLVQVRTKNSNTMLETGAPLGKASGRRSSLSRPPTKVKEDQGWRLSFKERCSMLENAQSSKNKKSDHAVSPLGEHIKTLAEVIRYAKESRVNYEHTERAQGLMLRMQIERLKLEDPKAALKAGSKGTSVGTVKNVNIAVRGAISRVDAIQGLVNLGFPRPSAADLVEYVDCEQKGYLNAGDWRSAIRAGRPAGIAELHSLHDFIMKQFRSLEAAYKNIDEDGTGELSTAEFEQALERLGWNQIGEPLPETPVCPAHEHQEVFEKKRAPAQELFALLDGARRSQLLGIEEFSLLACFANVHAMSCAEGIAKFMLEAFGSMEAAYRSLDRDRSGSVSPAEFELFLRENGCPGVDCVKEAFNFIDRECSGYISRRELVGLQGFSTRAFLKDIRLLRDQMIASYGSLESAFECIDAGDDKDREVSLSEFLEAWCRMDVGNFTKIDPRLLYHFLDTSHDRSVSQREWLRLRWFNADAAQVNVHLAWGDLVEKLGRHPEQILTRLSKAAVTPPQQESFH